MQKQRCPEWEYAEHPNVAILHQIQVNTLSELIKGKINTLEVAKDTRPQHHVFFRKLTPPQNHCYAGNYRGSDRCWCLKDYNVMVGTMYGTLADEVAKAMRNFEETVQSIAHALDKAHKQDSQLSKEDKIKITVRFACELFIMLGKIHPYANGNGHMQRLLIWAFLGRYGYWPERWSVHPRPITQPEYHILIQEYVSGNTTPLIDFILSCIELQPNITS
jgi:fido (protein-threonine AMPylation protein)